MIKGIIIKDLHGVNCNIKFQGNTILQGQSLLGKTTILHAIMVCYSGYYPGYNKSVPNGSITLDTDEGKKIMHTNRVLGLDTISDIIKNIIPGNFFRLNKTTGDQRGVITKILDIDTSILEELSDNISDCKMKLKEFKQSRNQITDDIIRLEDSIDDIGEITKVDKVEYKGDNSNIILEKYSIYISDTYKKINDVIEYNTLQDKVRSDNQDIVNNKYDFDKLSIIINNYKDDLINLVNKGNTLKDNKEYNCNECGTLIMPKDNTSELEELRIEYTKILNIKNKLEEEYTVKKTSYNLEYESISVPNYKDVPHQEKCITLLDKAKVVGLKYEKFDDKEYNNYINYITDSKQSETKKSVILNEIKIKTNQLIKFDSINIEKSMKKYEKDKINFNKNIEIKIKETGLDIRLFKILKNGNLRETFEIYDDKGNQYGYTSNGNDLYIELLIAKLFIKYLKLDFILIDKFESIGINLRDKVYEECKGLQIIATEVTKNKKIKTLSIK